LLQLALLGMVAGLLQVVFGRLGAGRLIRFIPYPVVSGYLTGVGLTLIGSQAPKLLDLEALGSAGWDGRPLLIGAVTVMAVVLGLGRRTRVPRTIWGLALGLSAYAALAFFDPQLRQWQGNALVLGAVGPAGSTGAPGLSFGLDVLAAWTAWRSLGAEHFQQLIGTAFILAVLLSIDTLKTCAALDQLTRSHHLPNRELMAQGWANLASGGFGGLAGAGTAGASLVALQSQASSRGAGLVQAGTALAALPADQVLLLDPKRVTFGLRQHVPATVRVVEAAPVVKSAALK
jgi:SulP family sulfate permease